MNQRELREKGLLYYYDESLINEINRGRELSYEFNKLNPNDNENKDKILRKLLGKIEGNYLINQPFYCDFGYNIEIGDNFFSNMNVIILDEAKVKFGKNVFIAPNCGFYTAGHPLTIEERRKGLEYAKPITIGDDVWIGAGSHILPGVTIGNNVVIGAGSVVTKDIPSNTLAYGNPCKPIRKI